jgi:hypothetical protein
MTPLEPFIESHDIPRILRLWANELREMGRSALYEPATYIETFEQWAGKIERTNMRLKYHLNTRLNGAVVGHVVITGPKLADDCE